METTIDKEAIKKAIFEFSANDPDYLDQLFEEIKIKVTENRRKKIEKIIDSDFKEYDSVFKALA